MSPTYRVSIVGLKGNVSKEDAINKLAAQFKTSADKVRPIFNAQRFVIKKGVDIQAAAKYEELLSVCGCVCLVEPDSMAQPEISTPSKAETSLPNDKQINRSVINQQAVPASRTSDAELVFCRGCGTKIHETAEVCPKCGASQVIKSGRHDGSKGWGGVFAWVIAFTPLIGAIAIGLIVQLTGFHSSLLLFVSVLINGYLCDIDSKDLAKHDVDKEQLGATWTIPSYLLKRSKLMNEHPAYFVTWCLVFLLQVLMEIRYSGGFE